MSMSIVVLSVVTIATIVTNHCVGVSSTTANHNKDSRSAQE